MRTWRERQERNGVASAENGSENSNSCLGGGLGSRRDVGLVGSWGRAMGGGTP